MYELPKYIQNIAFVVKLSPVHTPFALIKFSQGYLESEMSIFTSSEASYRRKMQANAVLTYHWLFHMLPPK